MPLIRMRIDVLGGFHGNPNGVRRGDIVDLDAASAERNVRSGYADYVAEAPKPVPPVEKAVAPEHETAKVEIPSEIAALAKPKPLDEPQDEEPEEKPRAKAPVKTTARRAGR
jgi:hypothetical protein